MNAPTFEDGPPVPMLVEGLMDAATLQQLFADLTGNAVLLGIQEKGGPNLIASPLEMQLSAGLERLLNGSSRALQVRYRFDGFEWTDTILASQKGYRVVRCRHDA